MFLNKRFYRLAAIVILLVSAGYVWEPVFLAGRMALAALLVVLLIELMMLYRTRGITATRRCAARFSNGDDNNVAIYVENHYPFVVRLQVIDEIPAVFQVRDLCFSLSLGSNVRNAIDYVLRPVQRGEYGFGMIRVFASTGLGLVSRRYSCGEPEVVRVYPSYMMLRRYELLAISNNLEELGIKKVRRTGHLTEFEHIKEYVKGDDYRTINWKASARRHTLMVNVFQDEKSQQVYNVIDKGRMMQRAFREMTLLDYAVNASLVLSYVSIHKEDKAGLVTFNEQFDTFLPASRNSGQMQMLLEGLYKQSTSFGEADYSSLCVHLGKLVNKRSLLILYTDFENLNAMMRQLSYLQQLNRRHRLLVVFFEDAELKTFIDRYPDNTESIYQQVIAEKFAFEKRLIVSTLQQYGIYSLLTSPDNLSVDVINKYLEMKSRHLF